MTQPQTTFSKTGQPANQPLSPSPPFLDDLLHILFRPGDKAIDIGQEGQRPVGQRVLDSRRHLGIDLPPDETILLERPQGGGQHLLRDVGDALPQLVETHDGLLLQGVKDQHRPFVADAGKDIPDRAIRGELAFQFILVHLLIHVLSVQIKSHMFLNQVLHLIDELHPDPIADRLAQEHGDRHDPDVGPEEAESHGDEITYAGQEDEEAHPRALALDPLLHAAQLIGVELQVLLDPLRLAQHAEPIAAHAAKKIAQRGRDHAGRVGSPGQQDARQHHLAAERQDRRRQERGDEDPDITIFYKKFHILNINKAKRSAVEAWKSARTYFPRTTVKKWATRIEAGTQAISRNSSDDCS